MSGQAGTLSGTKSSVQMSRRRDTEGGTRGGPVRGAPVSRLTSRDTFRVIPLSLSRSSEKLV